MGRPGGGGAGELCRLEQPFSAGNPAFRGSAAVDGGRQRGYTLGLNWHPNDLVRLLLAYNHVDYEKANGVVVKGLALGAPVGAKLDAISLRVQVSY
ncbi:MAG TPA: porin [Phenylobacterium sp.]|nr:porin [Phenylobacterium sp.]